MNTNPGRYFTELIIARTIRNSVRCEHYETPEAKSLSFTPFKNSLTLFNKI